MQVKSFLKFVEIKTKVASVFPYAIGLLLALYSYGELSFINSTLMFFALLMIDLSTTAINNIMDYKKAIKKEGYGYEIHNAIVQYDIPLKTAVVTVFIMLTLGTLLGTLLFLRTDYVVLILGIISFGIGILYSYGPVPISRTPFGEIISGFFMGFLILFITFYVNAQSNLIEFSYAQDNFIIALEIKQLIKVFIISLPIVLSISNIMLANNICDIKDDIENKRYTLPVYIGVKSSKILFKYLYYLAFILNVIGIIIWKWPVEVSLILLSYYIVFKNSKKFRESPSKKDTFEFAVLNEFIISITNIIIIIYSILK